MNNPYFYLIKTTWIYLGKRRVIFCIYVFMSILDNSLMLLIPYFFARVLNIIQEGGANLLNRIFWGLFLIFATRIVFWIIHWFARYMEATTSVIVANNLKEDLYGKLVHLPLRWHQENHSGKLINEINTATSSIRDFNQNHFRIMDMAVSFFGPIIALIILNPLIGALATLIGLVLIFHSIFFNRFIVRYRKGMIKQESFAASALQDYMTNIITVKSLRVEDPTKKEISERLGGVLPFKKRSAATSETKWLINDTIVATMKFSLTFYYIYVTIKSGLTLLIGNVSMIYSYLAELEGSFWRFNMVYTDLVGYKTDLSAVNHIFEAANQFGISDYSKKEDKLKDWNEIKIKGLSFKYGSSKNHEAGVNNLNINIKKGSKIALFGESGSGKSTLLKILRGLEIPDKIDVTIDGKDDPDSLHKINSSSIYIPQDPEIFENTIGYNITMGLPADRKRIDSSIATACFSTILKRLPKKLNSTINEKGLNLSGGEKQRLALARGIFASDDTDIVLLDEPTSSVDIKNENEIYQNIFEYFKGKTIISSNHNPDLLKCFDYIYVLEKGRVVFEGDYKEWRKTI